ncbi:hypothetical protein AAFF_G00433350 [Aldrovandia affinis]|uniref:Pirin n=1 Tax=Aldrovandia affinis TaxID=143900 RepID=A0AAD7S8Q8_9TELE|nr:hypothetical protein AAFF_G00433350 [Aldrovandia affinis]
MSEKQPEMQIRRVGMVALSVEQSEGVGARVRRSIGRKELKNLDPFLILDEFKVIKPGGFPDHPHRGFETVTYLLQGRLAHEDFCGHSGTLMPGDLQWMTAGRGVVHAEMPVSEEPLHGLQLWVNLCGAEKMVEPRYQELKSHEVPKPSRGGVTVSVISGEALGVKSKVYTRTPTIYLDFKLEQGATHIQPVPLGWTTIIYTLSGSVHVGPDDDQKRIEPHHTVAFNDGDHVKVENKTSEISHFVLIAGEPINEPVFQHGPFVMNTEDEIDQSISDYRSGTNGFEKAKTWKSKISISGGWGCSDSGPIDPGDRTCSAFRLQPGPRRKGTDLVAGLTRAPAYHTTPLLCVTEEQDAAQEIRAGAGMKTRACIALLLLLLLLLVLLVSCAKLRENEGHSAQRAGNQEKWERDVRAATNLEEMLMLTDFPDWKLWKCRLKLKHLQSPSHPEYRSSSSSSSSSSGSHRSTRYAAASYSLEILKAIDDEWQKTQCMPRETCVDVAKELGTSTGMFFKPPCVSIFRCNGCCNQEGVTCRNTSTTYVTKTLLTVIPFKHGPEPVLIKVANHTECKCMEPALIRRHVRPHRRTGCSPMLRIPESDDPRRLCARGLIWDCMADRCVPYPSAKQDPFSNPRMSDCEIVTDQCDCVPKNNTRPPYVP